MERVISEFRLVETDDGYRLEVKGDKEAMRKAMGDFWQRRHAHRGFPFPPFGGFGPWQHHARHWGGCCGPEEGGEQPAEGKKSE
jgi:hypothetical protein